MQNLKDCQPKNQIDYSQIDFDEVNRLLDELQASANRLTKLIKAWGDKLNTKLP